MIVTEVIKKPESKTLEFKRDLSSPKPILKSLIAFANSAGGRLVIGVTDDKQVIGVDDPFDAEERFCNLIADSIAPRLVPNVELITIEGKTVMVVEVFLSGSRPHWLNAEGPDDGVYVRLGSSNRKADRALIAELRRSAEGITFDETSIPELSIDDLDLDAIRQAFSGIRYIDEQSLLTLKILVLHQGKLVPTRGGILLFGKQRTFHFSDAWIQCGRFLGTEKIDIFDHVDIELPLHQAVDEVLLFLKKHAYRSADLSDVRRKDVWSIPLGMLREGIINAIVHSDYSQRGAPIRVTFLDDRIEIESMGILLPGLTVEEMKQGTSRIRNHVIARVFRELGLIEQWGTGVRRIFQEAKELRLPEPKIEEVGMRLRLTIYLAEKHKISSAGKGARSRARSGAQSEAVLRAISGGPLSASELMDILGLESKTGAFKRVVKDLLDQRKIEYTIPDKPTSRLQKYRLADNEMSSHDDHE